MSKVGRQEFNFSRPIGVTILPFLMRVYSAVLGSTASLASCRIIIMQVRLIIVFRYFYVSAPLVEGTLVADDWHRSQNEYISETNREQKGVAPGAAPRRHLNEPALPQGFNVCICIYIYISVGFDYRDHWSRVFECMWDNSRLAPKKYTKDMYISLHIYIYIFIP